MICQPARRDAPGEVGVVLVHEEAFVKELVAWFQDGLHGFVAGEGYGGAEPGDQVRGGVAGEGGGGETGVALGEEAEAGADDAGGVDEVEGGLGGDVEAEEGGGEHADAGVGLHVGDGGFEEGRGEKGVGVEEEDVVEVAEASPAEIVADADADVGFAEDLGGNGILGGLVEEGGVG